MNISSQKVEKANKVKMLSQALGLLSKDPCTEQFKCVKIALNPYQCSQQVISTMKKSHLIWQKITWIASKDRQFLNRIFKPLINDDIMISNLLDLYNSKASHQTKQLTFQLVRTDYFEDLLTSQPKLIQYNLMSVSMHGLSQKISQVYGLMAQCCKCQVHPKEIQHNKIKINQPLTFFISRLVDFCKSNQLKGIFIMVIQHNERNVMDQRALVIEAMRRGYQFIMLTFQQLYQHTTLDQHNNLLYKGIEVAVVYYRCGYKIEDYISVKGGDECWEAKRRAQLSTAIKIPSVGMELANQKRIQVQLSKPQVYQKYLQNYQWQVLKNTLVRTWDFDDMENHERIFQQIEKIGIQNIILKPNKEGGSNNIFGIEAYNFIKSLPSQKRKLFIAMEKIQTKKISNLFICDNLICQMESVSQISHYGIISSKNNKILQNEAHGVLVRTKPSNQNEGGIMTGVGAIGVMEINV